MITEKACTKCKEVKAVSEFCKCLTGKYGLNSVCKNCKNSYERVRRAINSTKPKRIKQSLEGKREAAKKYREKNKENYRKYLREWIKKNKNKVLESGKLQNKIRRESLSDNYVRCYISQRLSLKLKDIPQELIEAKRMQIKLHRLIKELR